jgi:hypothetical protein
VTTTLREVCGAVLPNDVAPFSEDRRSDYVPLGSAIAGDVAVVWCVDTASQPLREVELVLQHSDARWFVMPVIMTGEWEFDWPPKALTLDEALDALHIFEGSLGASTFTAVMGRVPSDATEVELFASDEPLQRVKCDRRLGTFVALATVPRLRISGIRIFAEDEILRAFRL